MRPRLPGSRRCGAAASLAPFRAVALRARRLPRTAPPPPAATSPRRNVPGAARRERVTAVRHRARCAGRRAKDRLTVPERRALSGSAPPASTVLRIPLRGTRLRRAVDPGDLCRPSGPDGEGQAGGQARNARRTSAASQRSTAAAGWKLSWLVDCCLGVRRWSSAPPPHQDEK